MTSVTKPKTRANRHGAEWWGDHLRQCLRSKKTMVVYAKEHGLKLETLYNWNGRLKVIRGGNRGHQTSGKKVANIRKPRLDFVEVSLEKSTPQNVELVAPNGWVLRVPADFDDESLGRFVSILEERS